MVNSYNLGKRIRDIRKIKGLSQLDIEKHTGFKREYLSRIENGKLDNPTIGTLTTIAEGLGVPIVDLLPETSKHYCFEVLITRAAELEAENRELKARIEKAQEALS